MFRAVAQAGYRLVGIGAAETLILERRADFAQAGLGIADARHRRGRVDVGYPPRRGAVAGIQIAHGGHGEEAKSEEHTSELQSLMRISYAVFCLKKKRNPPINNN